MGCLRPARARGVLRGLLFGARRARGGVPFQHSGYGFGHVTWLVFLILFLGGGFTLRTLMLRIPMYRAPMRWVPLLTLWLTRKA